MKKQFIPYGKQDIGDEEIQAVIEVLRSDYLTQGSKLGEFEQAICDYTGARYCVAVSNATAALHIAVKALDIEEGREGITTPNTFVASSNCLLYNHLRPVFADIESESFNISVESVRQKVNDKTSVLIPVHFAGLPAEMDSLHQLAQEKKLFIIEDASHAIGGNYPSGSKIGSCVYSDMTVFSFHPVKTMTTGEGGVITTNNEALYKKLLSLRSHGITRESDDFKNSSPGPWYYEMQELGYNYRLTELQAALGITQLSRLEEFTKRRQVIIKKYNQALGSLSWLVAPSDLSYNVCHHLYVVQINFEALSLSRKQVMEQLKRDGVGTQVHYIPVYKQPYYMEHFDTKSSDYPVCEKYYSKTLSLPLYPKMTDEDVDYVIEKVKSIAL
jgi:UDP-4-amino-4,6-dideoxy-N-acetyl-beta-L-altrosamine transaminase